MSDSIPNDTQAMSIVQRGNLKVLEQTLRKQWRMGQNIVLCWSADERGLLVLFVPHYFLGNYCAVESIDEQTGLGNEDFLRDLVSGRRRKTREELFGVASRLDVSPTFIKLNTALTEETCVLQEVEQLIKRYGISYVSSRAVMLFDISGFSLCTPFEQASQLNSLSYSMNSAYNKLLAHGVEINFARTTTGDGYYVWNRDLGANADRDLFGFMLLVVADNAVARAASKGNTTPVIRTGFHIGSHYELYQAEGVNPTLFSYIVGDVTIELARMIDLIKPGQVIMGDFQCEVWDSETRGLIPGNTDTFVRACDALGGNLAGIQFSGNVISSVNCYLTPGGADDTPLRFKVIDKHGLSRHAYNLQFEVTMEEDTLQLGLDAEHLPGRSPSQSPVTAKPAVKKAAEIKPYRSRNTQELIDDLSAVLKKRTANSITED